MANLLLFAMVESNSARFGNPPCESASARTGITADFHWDLTRDSFGEFGGFRFRECGTVGQRGRHLGFAERDAHSPKLTLGRVALD